MKIQSGGAAWYDGFARDEPLSEKNKTSSPDVGLAFAGSSIDNHGLDLVQFVIFFMCNPEILADKE